MTNSDPSRLGVLPFSVGRVLRISATTALVGTGALAVGGALDVRQALFSYLAAYAFAVSVALGALVFLMICHAMSACWPVAVRRLTEALVGTIPFLFVLFLPIAFGVNHLYPWSHPESVADTELRALLDHKRPYLNAPFFIARSSFYFLVWGSIAVLLRRWSVAQDGAPSAELSKKLKILSSAGLPPVALCLVFAAFDWLMSLSPEWFSTMFGVYYFAGGFIGALSALTILAASQGAPGRSLSELVNPSHFYALGRLLLAFTIFWAYVAFYQFFIIYVANRPEEAEWYVVRGFTSWKVITALLAVGHFVVPFLFLLSYAVKRRRQTVAFVAAWILAMHYVDVYWLVLPNYHEDGVHPHVLDLAALMTVGGAAIACAALVARRAALAPFNDPQFLGAVRYESR